MKLSTSLKYEILEILRKGKIYSQPFFILPKVHKTPISSRPIIASSKFVLTPLSKYINAQLQPTMKLIPYILKNSIGLIKEIDKIIIDKNYTFVVADCNSPKALYT